MALGDKLMFMWFLFILLVIGIGIVGGTLMFFGYSYDFRYADADALNQKIVKCISESDVNLETEFYKNCMIDEELIGENLYVIGILVDGEQVFKYGDYVSCEFSGKSDDFPRCFVREIIKDGKKFTIATGSSQKVGRVVG